MSSPYRPSPHPFPAHGAGARPSSYGRVFVAEYQQYKKIKVQKSGKGETGYKSCFLRK